MKTTSKPFLAYIMIVTGLIGFLFANVIMIQKGLVASDPSHIPPCNINPLMSCKTVMGTPQAEVFGFPNPLIGIAGFAMTMAIGFALLAGAKFKKWYWLGIQVGVSFALVFIYWLFYQSVYVIGALCLYCIYVWTITIPLFLFVTRWNIQEGYLGKQLQTWSEVVNKYTWLILVLMYGVIILAILSKFWSFWQTLI